MHSMAKCIYIQNKSINVKKKIQNSSEEGWRDGSVAKMTQVGFPALTTGSSQMPRSLALRGFNAPGIQGIILICTCPHIHQ